MSTLFIAGYAFMKQGENTVHTRRDSFAAETEKLVSNSFKFPKLSRCGIRTKQVLFCGAAALADAGNPVLPPDTGIITIGREGSFQENLLYWNDYCAFGREGARGHLFVGTLATTPPCELAIALGIHGSVYYFDPAELMPDLQREIESFSEEHENTPLFLVFPDGEKIQVFLLSPEKGLPLTDLERLLP